MRRSMKCLTALALLIAGLCSASAQTYWVQPYWGQPYWAQPYWSSRDYGLKARGYYGTPYGPGPQYGSGGGDQYGYGPGYSYARQAPNWYRGPY